MNLKLDKNIQAKLEKKNKKSDQAVANRAERSAGNTIQTNGKPREKSERKYLERECHIFYQKLIKTTFILILRIYFI